MPAATTASARAATPAISGTRLVVCDPRFGARGMLGLCTGSNEAEMIPPLPRAGATAVRAELTA